MGDNIENDSISTGSRIESLRSRNTLLRQENLEITEENAYLHGVVSDLQRELAECQQRLPNDDL